MFGWFDATEATEFGRALALFFIERMPLDLQMKEKDFSQKADKVLLKMANQVLRFRQGHKLNGYKKAKLGNAFGWALRDAGFDETYVDKLTKWLLLQLS